MHTLLDLRGNIPSFIHISDGKLHDVHALDMLLPEAGAIYVVDRGYVDFARLYHQAGAFRHACQANIDAHRVYSAPTDRTGIATDHLPGRLLHPSGLPRTSAAHPLQGPRVKTLVFITNNFSARSTKAAGRWNSWIKQHLRKQFYARRRTRLDAVSATSSSPSSRSASTWTRSTLQILSVTLFEKMPMHQAGRRKQMQRFAITNQLNLFDF